MDTEPLENEPVLRLKWLYVDEEYRGTGVAGSLIGEMVFIMAKNDSISVMTLDYSIDNDECELLGDLLQEWHFSFMKGLNPDFICNLSDISDIKKLERYSEWADNASKLRDKELLVIFRENFSGDNAYRFLLKGLPEGYLDKDICCYTGDVRNPEGLLLAHLCPSGKIRVEYFYCRPDSENRILMLLSCFFMNAVKKYPKDTEVVIPVEAIEVGEVLDKLVPDQKTDLMVEGILSRPSEEADITGEMLKEIMESL